MDESRFQRWVVGAVVGGGLVFALDRAVKYALMRQGSLGPLEPSLNDNIAFSLPFPRVFLGATIALIIALVAVAMARAVQRRSGFEVFGYGCVLIGAVSNVIDRLRFGSVVDYLHFWIVPIFNLADVLIVAGVAVLFIYPVWQRKGAG